MRLGKVFTRYRFRTIFTIALVIWVGVIFLFGTQSGEASSGISNKVTDWIIQFLNLQLTPEKNEGFHNFIRGAAHFSIYAVMGIFAFLTFVSYTSLRYTERIYYPLVICVAVASLDEFIQKLRPDRVGDPRDVAVDGAGALVFILLCAALVKWIKPLYAMVEYKPRPKLWYDCNQNIWDDDFIKKSHLKGMTLESLDDEDEVSTEQQEASDELNPEEEAPQTEESFEDNPEVAEEMNSQLLPDTEDEEPLLETEQIITKYIPIDSENEEPTFEESAPALDDADASVDETITEEVFEPVFDYIEPVAEASPVTEEAAAVTEAVPNTVRNESFIANDTPKQDEVKGEVLMDKLFKSKKPYPKRFELSQELYYAASVIGKVTVEAARRNNSFAKTAAPTNKNMERIYLTLGKTEYAKMEIVDVLNSDVSFDEKIDLINKVQKEAYEYFDSIIPQ